METKLKKRARRTAVREHCSLHRALISAGHPAQAFDFNYNNLSFVWPFSSLHGEIPRSRCDICLLISVPVHINPNGLFLYCAGLRAISVSLRFLSHSWRLCLKVRRSFVLLEPLVMFSSQGSGRLLGLWSLWCGVDWQLQPPAPAPIIIVLMGQCHKDLLKNVK